MRLFFNLHAIGRDQCERRELRAGLRGGRAAAPPCPMGRSAYGWPRTIGRAWGDPAGRGRYHRRDGHERARPARSPSCVPRGRGAAVSHGIGNPRSRSRGGGGGVAVVSVREDEGAREARGEAGRHGADTLKQDR
jgi:hypothetical protein